MKRLGSVHKNGPVEIHQIPARADNYIYLFHDETANRTAVIDPTDAEPVIDYCAQKNWRPERILITHHHPDHVGGNLALQEKFHCPITALKDDAFRIPGVSDFFSKDSRAEFAGHEFDVLFTPGHTLGHVCLHFFKLGLLFCGDTLFSFGCGRLFEGDPPMMLASLKKIRALPASTTFFCSHEYTLTNLEFAESLEPNSAALKKMHSFIAGLRDKNRPTIPAQLDREFALNPFLRWDDPLLKKALGMESATDVEVFAETRARRNRW